MTQDPAPKRGRGQPRIGTHRQVVLDDESDAVAKRYGRQGNRSDGLRELARIVRLAENGPACVRRWLATVRRVPSSNGGSAGGEAQVSGEEKR